MFFVAAAIAVLALVAGGFLGYRWGRAVEAKAQVALAAAKQFAEAVKK